ncbi:hypothetical protein GGS26DRAFT_467951 [Hypomontagnella submonticulosa]|nr:hypothetical protein GGS26DRAFT_467951 [Hypomontagnella submonticulosa]
MAQEEQVKDVYDDMEGFVRATHWSKPYFSNHHHENPPENPEMLGHVNCGYLSTPGRPPTLEALKKHAQSLTYLISTIAPSALSGEVDNENAPGYARPFEQHEAYDWLNNLQIPYDNIDRAHRKPLNSLVNLVKRNSDQNGVEFHCPLTTTAPKLVDENSQLPVRPYQTHMTLLMHANECLERLDHEYSALGGLLSIIPTDNEVVGQHPDLEKAKTTLVGQWLLFTQHLMSRMHELEISYANALDILANEAVVPMQHMSVYGPDGRAGREIVFPQDRWILANSGEDVFSFIHQMLDKKEGISNAQDRIWSHQNAVGGHLRVEDGDDEEGFIRGITYVDLHTRFYRLKASGRGPIFVLPAFADRPNTEYTKEMENRPTVVTVPAPSIPTQTSAWDRTKNELEARATNQQIQITSLMGDKTNLKFASEASAAEVARLRRITQIYEQNQGDDAKQIAERTAEAQKQRDEAQARYEACAEERNELKRQVDAYRATASQAQVDVPPEVEKNGNTYSMSEPSFRQYASRSNAILVAKPEIDKAQGVLQKLAADGHIDIRDFSWMNNINNSL